jgi:hypothetical protein
LFMRDYHDVSRTPWQAQWPVTKRTSSILIPNSVADSTSASNVDSSVGFQQTLPPPFLNGGFDKGHIKNLVGWFLKEYGEKKTIDFLEKLKSLGFHVATEAGISLGIEDLQIPPTKPRLISEARRTTQTIENTHMSGSVTSVEKSQWLIDTWNQTSDALRQNAIHNFRTNNSVNPVYMMAFSGARGNVSQVRQLVAMRGLMADPQGAILEFPIQSNFREGLTITEYLISCYGARKGLVDTALRTATSGYLTRRLVASAQHAVISIIDCQTQRGISLYGNHLSKRLVGRVLAEPIQVLNTKFLRNHIISEESAKNIAAEHTHVLIRSPLTCVSLNSICQYCYGWNLASGKLVHIGEAVGVIAGQSIGEPGTQLTMRTFHTGGVGVFSDQALKPLTSPYPGTVHFEQNLPGQLVRTPHGKIAYMIKHQPGLSNRIFLTVQPLQDFVLPIASAKPVSYVLREHDIPYGSLLFAKQGERVVTNQLLAQASYLKSTQDKLPESSSPVYSPGDGQVFFESEMIKRSAKKTTLQCGYLEDKKLYSALLPILSPTETLCAIPEPGATPTIGTVWILSGYNQSETQKLPCFVEAGDLVSTKSLLVYYGFFNAWYCQLQKLKTDLVFGFDLFHLALQQIHFKKFAYKLLLGTKTQDILIYKKKSTTDSHFIWYPYSNLRWEKETQPFYSYHAPLYADISTGGGLPYNVDETLRTPNGSALVDTTPSQTSMLAGLPTSSLPIKQLSTEIFPKGQFFVLKNSFEWVHCVSLTSIFPQKTFQKKKSQGHFGSRIKRTKVFTIQGKARLIFRYNSSIIVLGRQTPFLEKILGNLAHLVSSGQEGFTAMRLQSARLGPVCFTASPQLTSWLCLLPHDNFVDLDSVVQRQFIAAGRSFAKTSFSKQPVIVEYISAQALVLRKRKKGETGLSMTLREWYSVASLLEQRRETTQKSSLFVPPVKQMETFFASKNNRADIIVSRQSSTGPEIAIMLKPSCGVPISKALVFHAVSEYSFPTRTDLYKKWFPYTQPAVTFVITDPFISKQASTSFQPTKKVNIQFHVEIVNRSSWFTTEALIRTRCSFPQTETLSKVSSRFQHKTKTLDRVLRVFSYATAELKNPAAFQFQTYSDGRIAPLYPFTRGCVKSHTEGEVRHIHFSKIGTVLNVLRSRDCVTLQSSGTSNIQVGNLVRWGDPISVGQEGYVTAGQAGSSMPGASYATATAHSGQLLQHTADTVTLRRGTPILSSAGGIIHVSVDELVTKNQLIITLKSRRLQTEDIVQGIPKIEQLFEARQRQGGEALDDTVHTKLRNAFARELAHVSYHNWSVAVEKSVLEAQTFLVENVVNAYGNQGVTLAEKHVEVVVRQMTSRVRVFDGGETGLLPGEFVLRTWMQEFNRHIRDLGLREATYEPIVIGISKTVLQSDSFLVAASFQEVSRVLVRSALSKKRDFLSGLHENVIVGQAVPAGTGLITHIPVLTTRNFNPFVLKRG